MTTETHNTQAALDAGEQIGRLKTAGDVKMIGDTPFVLVPNGFALQAMENALLAPLAKRATVTMNDAASFTAYVNRFKEAGTVIFADLDARKFAAVIDYHEPGASARWGKHRASFACTPTAAWLEWAEDDGKAKNQLEFAQMIEDGIPDIAEPAGAALLEMVLTLESKKDVAFRSSQRLQDGQTQLRYEETITGNAGPVAGQLAIPDGFVLAIEPFRGLGRKRVDARFRYRIDRGVLTLRYELVRPEDVLQAAFDEVVAAIRAAVGDIPVLAGAAPVIS